jgi:hypothetical protein
MEHVLALAEGMCGYEACTGTGRRYVWVWSMYWHWQRVCVGMKHVLALAEGMCGYEACTGTGRRYVWV